MSKFLKYLRFPLIPIVYLIETRKTCGNIDLPVWTFWDTLLKTHDTYAESKNRLLETFYIIFYKDIEYIFEIVQHAVIGMSYPTRILQLIR